MTKDPAGGGIKSLTLCVSRSNRLVLQNQCFFVNEDDDENFRWRSHFNFRWRDENCDDNSDNFLNITKTVTKISVFCVNEMMTMTKWSERRKLFCHMFKICKRLSRPYSVTKDLHFTQCVKVPFQLKPLVIITSSIILLTVKYGWWLWVTLVQYAAI